MARPDQPLRRRDVHLVRVTVLIAVVGSLVDLMVVGHWLADIIVTAVALGALAQLGPGRRRQVLGLSRRQRDGRRA